MYYQKQADVSRHLYFARYADGYYDTYPSLPHFHNSIELYVVASGEYDVNIGGDRRRVRAGDIAFVDRFIPHGSGRIPGVEAEVYVVVASAEYFEGVSFLKKKTLPAYTERQEGFSRILDFVRWAYAAGEMNEEATRGFVTLLLGLLEAYCGTLHRTGEKHTRMLVDVMRYIGEHYHEPISLSSLSAQFGYEQTYLSRLFNRTLNMNLREYINRVRISAVKRLRAENPEAPLYKIYEACGFENENTYYRASRRYNE